MQSRIAAVIALSLLFAGTAVWGAGESYGTGIGSGKAVTTLELLADPDKYVGQRVQVKGRITDVCPKMGCWIDIAGKGDDKVVRFKVKDGEIVFPMSVKGERVVAEGVFTKHEMTREEALSWARHLAEEKNETFDEASWDGSTTLYRIEGAGAVVNR
jgi:hypothetical protein